MSEETLERETRERVIGKGEQVRVLRSGRDLYFVQTVKDGEPKEGWVPGSWLLERGFDEQIPSAESQEELEAGADIEQELSSEASEPELERLKETGECKWCSFFFYRKHFVKKSECEKSLMPVEIVSGEENVADILAADNQSSAMHLNTKQCSYLDTMSNIVQYLLETRPTTPEFLVMAL